MKKLVAPVIPQFAKHFPTLLDKAIDVLLDLCEDDAPEIRMEAFRGFGTLTKNLPSCISRVSGMLAQLLVIEDEKELQVLKGTLGPICRSDFQQVSQALMHHIKTAASPLREKVLAFFGDQMSRNRSTINKNTVLQNFLVHNITGVLKEVGSSLSASETSQLFRLLSYLSIFSAKNPDIVASAKDAFDAVAKLTDEFDGSEDAAARLVEVLKMGGLLASRGVDMKELPTRVYTTIAGSLDDVKAETWAALVSQAARYESRLDEETLDDLFPSIVKCLESCAPASAGEGDAKEGEAATTAPNLGAAESLLFSVSRIAAKKQSRLKKSCGIFISTGQPSDFATELVQKKENFTATLNALDTAAKAQTAAAKAEIKTINEKIKESKEAAERSTLGRSKAPLVRQIRCSANVSALCAALPKLKLGARGLALSSGPKPKPKKPQPSKDSKKQGKGGKGGKAAGGAKKQGGKGGNQQAGSKRKRGQQQQQQKQQGKRSGKGSDSKANGGGKKNSGPAKKRRRNSKGGQQQQQKQQQQKRKQKQQQQQKAKSGGRRKRRRN